MGYNIDTRKLNAGITANLSQGALDKLRDQLGKTFDYKLMNGDFSQVIATGRCEVLNRYYNIALDCDVITFRDLDTNETKSVNQFRLNLHEAA